MQDVPDKANRPGEVLKLLLIEDNIDHAELMIRTLERERVAGQIEWVKDGEAALDYLFAREPFLTRTLPDLILMDLQLPKVNGWEVLAQLKNDPELRQIPVVVLTTSAIESDRRRAYQQHANSYLVKPAHFGRFRKMVRELLSYWGKWNQPAMG